MRIGAFELSEPLPALRDPHVIAGLTPWLDAGNVGTLVLSRLTEHFKAQTLGELVKPGQFFDFTRYRPSIRDEDGQRVLQIPNATISYAPSLEGHDFLFVNILEPHLAAEDYIECLAEVLGFLKVRRHVRVGAWYDAVPHTRPLPVSYTLRGQQVDLKTGAQTRPQGRYQGPTSMMNQLTDRLEREGIENAAFTVRLPYYAQLEEDFTGLTRVLSAMSSVYSLPPSLTDAIKADEAQGVRLYEKLSTSAATDRSVLRAIQQMEARYDADAVDPTPPPAPDHPPLSPEIERFLREISDKPPGDPGPPSA